MLFKFFPIFHSSSLIAAATIAAGALAGLAGTASATVIINDNFAGSSGASLNSSYWDASSGNTLNGNGTANIGGTSNTLEALSSLNTAPSATQFVRAFFSYTVGANWNNGFDLTNDSNSPSTEITLRNDTGDNNWDAQINNGPYYNTGVNKPGPGTPTTVQLDWYTNKVVAWVDGVQIYDSSVDTPLWIIPTNAAHPLASGYSSFTMNAPMTFETVSIPEPATLGLMAMGGAGLLFLKRRKTA